MTQKPERSLGRARRFNILDMCVVVFFTALSIAVALRLNLNNRIGSSGADVIVAYSVRVEPVRIMTVVAVEVGDPLFDEETGTHIGTVTDVSAEPYLREAVLADGTSVLSIDSEYYTLLIQAVGGGKKSVYGPMLAGSRLCTPGGVIKVGSTRLSTTGQFDQVDILEEG